MVMTSKESVLTALTTPDPKHFCPYGNISNIPQAQGLYAWYFNGLPPNFPVNKCVVRHEKALLYVGESGKLNDRMQEHSDSVTLSTMRKNLVKFFCIYGDLSSVDSVDIEKLDAWMNQHAFVVWTKYHGDRNVAEQHFMDNIWVVLNIRGNQYANVSNL